MKALTLMVMGFALVACTKQKDAQGPAQGRSLKETAGEVRDSLFAFSVAVGEANRSEQGIPPTDVELPEDTVRATPPNPIPSAKIPARNADAPRQGPAKVRAAALQLPPDSLSGLRPFTAEEVAAAVRASYQKASAFLSARDPRFHRAVEDGQAYSKDGSFFLLKARWALAEGRTEQALVQADLALRASFLLNPEGAKQASYLRCVALDSIKHTAPSEHADAAAARAWLTYTMTFSP